MANSQTIQAQMLQENASGGPIPRASQCSAVYGDKFYVFGGQDDDNNKLDDMWEYDLASSSWRQIQIPEGGLCPLARSGHSAVTYGNRMYIFGGILELTKELNDLLVYDFSQGRFVQGEERPEFMEGSPMRRQGTMQEETYGDSNASPTRTKGATLNRRRTLDASPSPKLKSPTKLKRLGSPEKATRSGADGRR